jgi:hypothetical protein
VSKECATGAINQVGKAKNFITNYFSVNYNRVFHCDAIFEIAVNGSIQPPFSLVQPGNGHLEININKRDITGLNLMGNLVLLLLGKS